MTRHIVVDITGHGFGHAAMTLPVVSVLHELRPNHRLTIRSTLPEAWLRERCAAPFGYASNRDFGMVMVDSLQVRAEETLRRYTELHADWEWLLADEAEALRALEPDLVVSNVSYLALAAAAAIGAPRVAYSSLNWADVFWEYCGDLPGAGEVMRRMVESYAAAEVFLQPAPSMAMPSIRNGRAMQPVAKIGRNRRAEVARALGMADERLVLVSLGGIATGLDFASWPALTGWRVVSGGDDDPDHPAIVSWKRLGMPFIDALASADLLVIKPGYGLITEGVCNAKPLLYAPRDRWPETEAEIGWLNRHGRGRGIGEEALRSGRFLEAAEALLKEPIPKPPRADGALEVAGFLIERLERGDQAVSTMANGRS